MTRPTIIDRDYAEEILEAARKKLAKNFGVSVVEDNNGTFAAMGAHYLTLRFYHKDDFVEIHTQVMSVRSGNADDQAQYDRECPQ